MKPYLGIDIGGSKLALTLSTPDKHIISKKKYSVDPEQRAKDILESCIADFKTTKIGTKDIYSVGVACPGPINFKTGSTCHIPNMPHWRNLPLKSILNNILNRPIYIDNDGNLAAFAEAAQRKDFGSETIIYLTISSGIGGGIVINNSLYHGASFDAGEIGHIPITSPFDNKSRLCGCRNRGCLEAYSSGFSIYAQCYESAEQAGDEILLNNLKNNPSAKYVISKALQNEPIPKSTWNSALNYLAHALTILIQSINPHAIILGGSVTKGDPQFIQKLQLLVSEIAWNRPYSVCEIILASYGDDVVDYGIIEMCNKFR